MRLLFTSLTLCLGCLASKDLILQPIKDGEPMAFVLLCGAMIPPERYLPLAQAVQNATDAALWVAVPEFFADFSQPLAVAGAVDRVRSSMYDSGLAKDGALFVGGHSIGGTTIQGYAEKHSDELAGQVLLGSFVSRKSLQSIVVPTLSVGGELDGLARASRFAQAYYTQITTADDREAARSRLPVVILPGVTHMQFASGEPPLLVRERDLVPEVTYEAAHSSIASVVSSFFHSRTSTGSVAALQKHLDSTEEFVAPLVEAMLLEGNYNLKKPCYEDEKDSSKCQIGCPWTEQHAQVALGGLEDGRVLDYDEFHQVWRIPFHLPKILNKCEEEDKSCVLKTTSITQGVYDTLDMLDTGFASVTASELRVKMNSRQLIWESVGRKNVSFSVDEFDFCAEMNQKAYNWALSHASEATIARFKQSGTPYVIGPDKGPYSGGPTWIWNPLSFVNKKDASGQAIVEIRSPMMRTPTDFKIKLSAGFHYCKLLSPARALEWIQLDSLRATLGLSKQ
jgi:hypothetical protein